MDKDRQAKQKQQDEQNNVTWKGPVQRTKFGLCGTTTGGIGTLLDVINAGLGWKMHDMSDDEEKGWRWGCATVWTQMVQDVLSPVGNVCALGSCYNQKGGDGVAP